MMLLKAKEYAETFAGTISWLHSSMLYFITYQCLVNVVMMLQAHCYIHVAYIFVKYYTNVCHCVNV